MSQKIITICIHPYVDESLLSFVIQSVVKTNSRATGLSKDFFEDIPTQHESLGIFRESSFISLYEIISRLMADFSSQGSEVFLAK